MNPIYTPKNWSEYELLDSGNEAKLERFNQYIFVRPEPKAIWKPTLPLSAWQNIHAEYMRSTTGGGNWVAKKSLPSDWNIQWNQLRFILRPTGFKHIGIFPEQAPLWEWIIGKIQNAGRPIKVLNLFAYTGGSTIAAASAGASVTHLDSSKDVVTWAHENAIASGLGEKPIRWIEDDAMTFVKREIKRGNKYDAIIMDPPKFGRGSRGEVWKIQENLPHLFELCSSLLSDNPLFFMMVTYTTEYSSQVYANLLAQTMEKYKGNTEAGEIGLQQSSNNFVLPLSVFTRWSA